MLIIGNHYVRLLADCLLPFVIYLTRELLLRISRLDREGKTTDQAGKISDVTRKTSHQTGNIPAPATNRQKWYRPQPRSLPILLVCVVNAVVILVVCASYGIGQKLLLGVTAGCLIMASETDLESTYVYDYVWWISNGTCILLLIGAGLKWRELAVILFYCLLQECFFVRFYGRGDCHAFSSCAVAAGTLGVGMLGLLLHMAAAFGLLALVQAWRHNIGKDGNLLRPVAFLPYITVSFWICLLCARHSVR